MILVNPFTRQVLNANPKGCNQYTGEDCSGSTPIPLKGTKVGTHVSSNLESLLAGIQDRPKVGMSIARHRGEEMSSPTIDEPKGKTGRALVKIVGQGLDYDRPDHRAFIDKLVEEDSQNVIPKLRELGVDWVNGWNSIGSDEELHLIKPSKAKILKSVESPLDQLRRQSQEYRVRLEQGKVR